MKYIPIIALFSVLTGVICTLDMFIFKKRRGPFSTPGKIIEGSYHLFPISLMVLAFFVLNFAEALVLFSVITGLIYGADYFFFKKRRAENTPTPHSVAFAHEFFPVLVIVLIFRSFLLEPFRIPSGSLEPTLNVGDFVAVNKFAYGLRLPVLETQFLNVEKPKRGQIAVFRWPPNPEFDFIKRVMGVPGDTIEYKNKVFYINGQEIKQKFIRYTKDESSGHTVKQYEEDLNGLKHAIYVRSEQPALDFKLTVPEGQYFMIGDNRDDSADSRYWGFVGEEYLRGRAFLVWMSWNGNTHTVRTSGLFRFIH